MRTELDFDDIADRIVNGQLRMAVKLREGARDRIRDALKGCEWRLHRSIDAADFDLIRVAERALEAEIVHPEPAAVGWCNRIPKAA